MTFAAPETVRFASSEPAGFAELLANEARLPRVDVAGLLYVPVAAAVPLPLVITSIGSLGLASGREELYAAALTAAGIAMLVVDSFGSRGFAETFSDQGRISFATSCADALHALRHVGGDPRFDRSRIALFGYSRGGCAVLMADDERLQQQVPGGDLRFAAYVALYPSVWIRWANPRPTHGPCLIVHGGADDLAPPPLVAARAQALGAAGAVVETVLIPGAAHSFDSINPRQASAGETNMSDCEVLVEDDGAMHERTSGVRLEADWPGFVQRVRAARGKTGGTTGHGPAPREVAVAPVLGFLKRAFA